MKLREQQSEKDRLQERNHGRPDADELLNAYGGRPDRQFSNDTKFGSGTHRIHQIQHNITQQPTLITTSDYADTPSHSNLPIRELNLDIIKEKALARHRNHNASTNDGKVQSPTEL